MPKNRHAGIHSVISVLIAAFWRGSLERPFVSPHIYPSHRDRIEFGLATRANVLLKPPLLQH
jgi:hypothetical protein